MCTTVPRKQAFLHELLQWEDFAVLYWGLCSYIEGTQRCYEHNTTGQAPSQLVLNSWARFIQCITGSGETFLPPARSTQQLTVCLGPLDRSTTSSSVSPLPLKALRDPHHFSKRRVFYPWLARAVRGHPAWPCLQPPVPAGWKTPLQLWAGHWEWKFCWHKRT